MDPRYALLVYFLVLLLMLAVARTYSRLRLFSAVALALIAALLVLAIVNPISAIDRSMRDSPWLSVYAMVYFVSFLVVVFYVVYKAVNDEDDEYEAGKPLVRPLAGRGSTYYGE